MSSSFPAQTEQIVLALVAFGEQKKILVIAWNSCYCRRLFGGLTPHPTYEEVCSGQTGHAEVVLIVFDPTQVSLAMLLRTFGKSMIQLRLQAG